MLMSYSPCGASGRSRRTLLAPTDHTAARSSYGHCWAMTRVSPVQPSSGACAGGIRTPPIVWVRPLRRSRLCRNP